MARCQSVIQAAMLVLFVFDFTEFTYFFLSSVTMQTDGLLTEELEKRA